MNFKCPLLSYQLKAEAGRRADEQKLLSKLNPKKALV